MVLVLLIKKWSGYGISYHWSRFGSIIIKKWSNYGILLYSEMEQLWYFLLRNGPAMVFLIKEWSRCGISC